MFIRRLPKFEYHAPGSLPEALSLLASYGNNAKLLAGGTDLLLAMKKRAIMPTHLINLKTVPGLSGIAADEAGVTIGAMTTMAEIKQSAIVRKTYGPLWDAACVMGSPQVRSIATIGGNLVSAVPSADTAPPLMALSAVAHIAGPSGERTCSVQALFAGPSKSCLGPADILTRITVPMPEGKGTYLKLMRRAALDLSLVGVAAFVAIDAQKVCKSAKIFLGAVAPAPMHATAAENILLGKTVTDDLFAEAAKAAGTECRPISDVRASLDYRCSMVEVLTRRALLKIVNQDD